jgi:hypothetical protein
MTWRAACFWPYAAAAHDGINAKVRAHFQDLLVGLPLATSEGEREKETLWRV